MGTPERLNQPPCNVELMEGFAGVAILSGDEDSSPLDPSLAPGDDGTFGLDGRPVHGFRREITWSELPSAIRDKNIKRLTVGWRESCLMDGVVVPQQSWISIRGRNDFEVTTTFFRQSEEIATAHLEVGVAADTTIPAAEAISDADIAALLDEFMGGPPEEMSDEAMDAIRALLDSPDEPTDDFRRFLGGILAEISG